MTPLTQARWALKRRGRRIAPDELRLRRVGAFTAAKGGKQRGLIPELVAFISRYVVMTEEQALVCALWTVHTHCFEWFEQTPYLAITSPEKRCGKTRLMEVIDQLVARPWLAIQPSEAIVYRKIEKDRPTLMLDEVDAIFNPKTADKHEHLRAMLNAGNRNGAKVARCIGVTGNMAEFAVYCPKVLAGIGALPDTVADRAVPIRLQRRTSAEPVSRFYRRDVKPETDHLREHIEAWVTARTEALADARPEMPDELSDRMQEGCECLVAIADAAGCGREARTALVSLLSGERADDQETMRLRLLRDLRTIFEHRGNPTSITTAVLLQALMEVPESPWPNYYGKAIDDRGLASLLRTYEVKSTTIRYKKDKRKATTHVKPAKGYRLADLHPVWERYLEGEQ